MRALVTGSNGALGAVVVQQFERLGWEVVGLDLPDDITDRSTL
jgi:nucleoside-diphosphate-sugar epimerase